MTAPSRALAAEFMGSAFLLAAIVGSGIMAERLSGGNTGLALLANALATAAMLFVLITALGPVSGAQFNPVVSAASALRGTMAWPRAVGYMAAQAAGAIAGVLVAHAMFDLPMVSAAAQARSGFGQWIAETVATFGLLTVIFQTSRNAPAAVPANVSLYILAAYWFTASTSFANPAVTIARSLTGTFSGIRMEDAPAFIAAQIVGAALALVVDRAFETKK